jgi:hypothetical protein
MTAARPTPLPNWRIEAHCRHCDWQTVWYVNRAVGRFYSHDQALEYVKQHPHGPDVETSHA